MSHANPHFVGRLRPAYELSTLLRELPSTVDLTSADKRLQLEAAEKHAENYSVTLLDGLESLGRVMWIAGENKDWPVEQHDVARMGDLISQLAIQLQFLGEFRTGANYELAQAEMKESRKKDIPDRQRKAGEAK